MENQKGTLGNTLRLAAYDCTLNGLSSKYDTFYLIGDEVAKKFETSDPNKPVLKLVKRHLFGEDYYHAEPLEKPKGKSYSFGGNYLTVSRHDAPTKHPLPIHDRSE